jgi:hypothetical protein
MKALDKQLRRVRAKRSSAQYDLSRAQARTFGGKPSKKAARIMVALRRIRDELFDLDADKASLAGDPHLAG